MTEARQVRTPRVRNAARSRVPRARWYGPHPGRTWPGGCGAHGNAIQSVTVPVADVVRVGEVVRPPGVPRRSGIWPTLAAAVPVPSAARLGLSPFRLVGGGAKIAATVGRVVEGRCSRSC
jgi:hypothetical protein